MTRFTLVELMVVVAIVMVLAAIAIPNFYEMQLRAKRSEVPLVTEGLASEAIAAAEADQLAVFVACADSVDDWTPEDGAAALKSGSFGKSLRPWTQNEGLHTSDLGFRPDGDIRGAYTFSDATSSVCAFPIGAGGIPVSGCPSGVCTYGASDVDGDTVLAGYEVLALDLAGSYTKGWTTAPDLY